MRPAHGTDGEAPHSWQRHALLGPPPRNTVKQKGTVHELSKNVFTILSILTRHGHPVPDLGYTGNHLNADRQLP